MKLLTRMMRKQAGQALPMALILMLLGGFLVVPLLDLTTTNLNATRVIDLHTREMYAADAGVEDALWYLQSEERVAIKNPTNTWPIPPYNLDENINSKDVQVTIDHAWLLSSYRQMPATEPKPSPDPTYIYYANDHWTTIGALDIDANPRNKFIADISTDQTAQVDHIGVWLPQGYSYLGNVTINGVTHAQNALVKDPNFQDPLRGGTALIWIYSGIAFKSLSDIALPPPGGGVTPAAKFPPSVRLSFDYSVTPFKEARGFFPWITLTSGKISWDADAGFYHVVSVGTTPETGTNTMVEAYVPKGVIRYVSGSSGASSAIQGDYIVIGNSLMTSCWRSSSQVGPPCSYDCTYNCHGKYFSESSATVNANAVPSDAKIQKVYLYWTAWQNTSHTTADTEATLKVNDILVGTNGTVTADTWYVLPTKDGNGNRTGYQYASFADVTDLVKAKTAPNYAVNNAKFTVSGVYANPATSCSGASSNIWLQATNAGWSMIIIYSSTSAQVHQIYMYNQLAYLWGLNGASEEFTIVGFQTPTSNRDAKVGYFVAEGDPQISPDYFQFQGQHSANYVYLGDHNTSDPNPYNNVYNSYSTATGFTPSTLDGQAPGTISGIDLDIYTQDKDGNSLSNIVQGGDTWAKIRVNSVGSGNGCDGIMITYVIFSVSSTAIPAGQEFNVGSMLYRIE
jgi:hypothetical protein